VLSSYAEPPSVSDFGMGFLNPIIGAVVYERIPRPLLGRLIALSDSAAWAGIPLGALAGGLLIGPAGLSPVLIAFGLGYLLITSGAELRPEGAVMDDRRRAGRSRAKARAAPAPAPDVS